MEYQRVLENVEPKGVFRFFEDLTRIPHGSHHEKELSDYVVRFAEERGLPVIQDSLYNVIISCPATPGYEDVPGCILQGHLDMVWEKAEGSEIDFLKDPLELVLDGDTLTARGTTLGGDDGIAVAYMLAVMDDRTLPHPSLEAVFTVSEETGMEGAAGIDLSSLKNRRLINLDSEDEGIFLTSCAGGGRVDVTLPLDRERRTGVKVTAELKGFSGGHSGMGIIRGGANAPVMTARIISRILDTEGLHGALIRMDGGNADNVIPKGTTMEWVMAPAEVPAFREAAEAAAEEIREEYRSQDPEFRMEILAEEEEITADAFTRDSLEKAVSLIFALPNGVQAMSAEVPDFVETSLNLGVMKTGEKELKLGYAVRSSRNSAKEFLIARMKRIAAACGAGFSLSGIYPAWEYRADSPLRDQLVRVFTRMYGYEPKVEGVHAGVECGLIADKLEGIDAVSLGPDMKDVHTPEESLSVSSVARVWDFLREVLSEK